ncbi:hypothetical protein NtRootA9_29120 [Arthrobacter sp. NtRootA9]|nr:hypothetical protein NtRootA9_29120 [Arthrobacter sp. NtRootA9]
MGESGGETGLTVSEGVLLGHALVARVAEDLGVRVFFIKGPASVQLGLRRPKISNDVDVFVAPADLELLLDGLRERGWRERPVDPDSRSYAPHSVTVDHPGWPCCIDVHFRFPGMDFADVDGFEVLWSNTVLIPLAAQDVRVHSEALGILIVALHALRLPHTYSSFQDLGYLRRVMSNRKSIEVLQLAETTGSLAAIRPFLEPALPPEMIPAWPQPSREWRDRLRARVPGAARLLALLKAPISRKLPMLWRAVFPSAKALLSVNIYGDMTLRGRCSQNAARWLRFTRSVHAIVRDLALNR